MSIPSLLFGGIGIVMLLLAGGWALSSRGFVGGAARAEGTVVRIEKESRGGMKARRQPSPPVTYSPMVSFVSADGTKVVFTALGAGEAAYKEGDHVPVLYSREQPHDAKIDSEQELGRSSARSSASCSGCADC